jgi:transcriptional regulator with XRE-family HTH domain
MDQNTHQNQDALVIYRRRMGFTQRHVARLLGFKDASMLSRYEHGRSLPPLMTAFRLGIVLRVPLEFLFPALYDQLRNRIREQEELLAQPVQQAMF